MQRTLSKLKATHLIPPVAALVLVIAWNATELRTIASQKKDTAALQQKITTAQAAGPLSQDPAVAKAASQISQQNTRSSCDWRQLATFMDESQPASEKARLRAITEFQKNLAEMSRQEIINALDEIDGLDLTAAQRQALESEIIGSLIEQDPEYALKRFAERIVSDPDEIGSQLSAALRDWAKNDLTAATAWFDRQIADGNFTSKTLDGNSETRASFEAALMESLLSSDPAAAARRLAEMPEDQRREILEQLPFDALGETEQGTYTALVRGLVPADERQGAFANISSQLIGEGYAAVAAFLDSAKASPEERAAAAGQAAQSQLETLARKGNVTQKDVDELRTWLASQAATKIDSITGKAIAEAAQDGGKFKFAEASQLILHYQQISGSDDGLVSFLQSYAARSNLQEAVKLADQITDPQRRAQILQSLR
jgi:hypothetical protein